MKTYNMEKPNRALKAKRMQSREGLFPFYGVVARLPESGRKAYTKLVTISKAIVLLRGRRESGFDGTPTYRKLSREFTLA